MFEANSIVFGYAFIYALALDCGVVDLTISTIRYYNAALEQYAATALLMKYECFIYQIRNMILLFLPLAWAIHLHIIKEPKSDVTSVKKGSSREEISERKQS